MANVTDTQNLIKKLTVQFGKEKTEKLVAYVDKVLERNEHINLTAVRDRDEAMQKHLADSLAAADLPEFQEAHSIIDIGTGAGFPGALLAIAFPEKSFVLMDSTLKRLKVIDEFAQDLQIANLRTIHGRAEELARKDEYNARFDVCVSRAVASLDKLCGWCLPYVRSGGYFIPYKGENYETELKDASSKLKKNHGVFLHSVSILEDNSDISGHVLLVIKKK